MATQVALGQQVFAQNCTPCHGQYGEGRMGPPHNQNGHTWEHSDTELIQIVTDGKNSRMPAFGERLNADEIAAALSYIKTLWTDEERQYQTRLSANPPYRWGDA